MEFLHDYSLCRFWQIVFNFSNSHSSVIAPEPLMAFNVLVNFSIFSPFSLGIFFSKNDQILSGEKPIVNVGLYWRDLYVCFWFFIG